MFAKERTFDRYAFSHVGLIQPERDVRGAVIDDFPQPRYRNERNLPLHKYGQGPFGRFRVAQDFSRSGVYVLTNGCKRPLYVGECVSLASRWRDYGRISPRAAFARGRETDCRMNSLIHQELKVGANFDLWFYPIEGGKRARKAVESELIAVLKPLWNR